MKAETRSGNRSRARLWKHTVAAVAFSLFVPVAAWSDGVVTNCTEADLRAAMAGGGTVTFACDGTITLASTITNAVNTTLDGSGHQVTISGGNAVRVFVVNTNVLFAMVNLTIANGRSVMGAGVLNSGVVQATNCVFFGNVASNAAYPLLSPGGGIYNAATSVLSRCAFLQNQAIGWAFQTPAPEAGVGQGGGIANVGQLFVESSLFAGNQAIGLWGGNGQDWLGTRGSPGGSACGGALFNAGVAALINSTIASNICVGGNGGRGGDGPYSMHGLERIYYGPGGNGGAGGSGLGGGIYSVGSPMALTNCTVAYNSATAGDGGYFGGGSPPGVSGANGTASGSVHSSGTAAFINSLLAANSPTNASGVPADLGHNLSSDGSCAFANAGSLNNTDAQLGPLDNNGGSTLTMALLTNSPAIDAGENTGAPASDQRGFPRPLGAACDIGAYEYCYPAACRISRASGDVIDVTVYGTSGQICRLLTSTTLSNWQSVATNQIGPDGTAHFQDNFVAGETRRFYRVAVP